MKNINKYINRKQFYDQLSKQLNKQTTSHYYMLIHDQLAQNLFAQIYTQLKKDI
jgi:hypothetical protein